MKFIVYLPASSELGRYAKNKQRGFHEFYRSIYAASQDIIDERTPEEEKYDKELIKCLKKYGKIRKAINRANKMYPDEALKYDEDNIGDIEAHYDYLMSHMEIVGKVGH